MGILSSFKDQLEDPLDLFGGKAQREATAIQTQLSNEGLGLQRDLFNQLFSDQAPVRASRDEALALLTQLQSGNFTPFTDPSMDFRRGEDINALKKRQAARGKLAAGETFIGEQDINAQYQADAMNKAVMRLLNLAGFSTGDVAGTNPLLQYNIGAQGGIMQNLGNIQAQGIMGQAGSRNQAINTGFGILGGVAGRQGWFQ